MGLVSWAVLCRGGERGDRRGWSGVRKDKNGTKGFKRW